MKLTRTILAVASIALLLSFGAPGGEAMVHKKKESNGPAIKACVKAAEKPCGKTAAKECSGKSGFSKKLCEKSAKKACMEGAKKSCKKSTG